MMRVSGKVMTLLLRSGSPATQTGVPADLFAADEDPTEATALSKVYIFGSFDEKTNEDFTGDGRMRVVEGVISVPMIYQSVLAKAEYIDPYNDGSRFVKMGKTLVDDERLFIYQGIRSQSLANVSEVTS